MSASKRKMSKRRVSKKVKVKVTLFPPFSKKTSRDEINMTFEESLTVKDLIHYLVSTDDRFKTYLGEMNGEEETRFRALIIHNDHIAKLDERLSDGDSLKFLHPLQGG
jgi:molybdopterin converting factor small subunit